jgi:hypothetical protein
MSATYRETGWTHPYTVVPYNGNLGFRHELAYHPLQIDTIKALAEDIVWAIIHNTPPPSNPTQTTPLVI